MRKKAKDETKVVREPLADGELEDVAGGVAPSVCISGDGTCDGGICADGCG